MVSINKSIIPVPSPVKFFRVGGDRDGAYLVPNDLKNIESCFSPGVSKYKWFEDQLAKEFNIKSYMCDYSTDISKLATSLIEGYQFFDKKFLGIKNDNKFIRLDDWVNNNSPDPKEDLILQMDIEGAEYENINDASLNLLKRFRIIVIELHFLKSIFHEGKIVNNIDAYFVNNVLDKLSINHSCIHAHPNNCSSEYLEEDTKMNIPDVLELTYLRKDRFSNFQGETILPELPSPLDITSNCQRKQPIILNNYWNLNKEKSVDSKIKVLDEKLQFRDTQVFLALKKEIDTLKKEIDTLKKGKNSSKDIYTIN